MRYWPWLLCGFGLLWLSKLLEGFGDALPFAAEGASWDRAAFHGAALVALLAGLGCFIRAMLAMWRRNRGGKVEARKLARVFDEGDAPRDFDPDAALARYLEKRTESGSEPNRPAPTSGGGFGRRGL